MKQVIEVKTTINSVVESRFYPITETFDEDYADYLRQELEEFLLFGSILNLEFILKDVSSEQYDRILGEGRQDARLDCT